MEFQLPVEANAAEDLLADTVGAQRLDERRRVHEPCAGAVDENGVLLHHGKLVRADEGALPGLVAHVDGDEVGLPQQLFL